MTVTYGVWTVDHYISVVVIGVMLGVIHSIRYFQNFSVYAGFFCVLIILSVLATSLPERTGINSALLPFLVVAPLFGAVITGPRMTVAIGFASVVTIGFLYMVSMSAPVPEAPFYAERNAQRAIQAIFCSMMVMAVGTSFSAHIYRAFELLENSVARAQSAEAAKTRFLATMSHELRTPMNGVLGLADALERTELNDDQRELLTVMKGSGRSLMGILNDILDLSKIEADKLEISPNRFSPSALIEEAAAMWRESAQAKGLTLTVIEDSVLPATLVGDDLRIRQILSKLLSNAVKFTRSGHITVSVRCAARASDKVRLHVSVTDTGIGVARDQLGRIFEPFEQADRSISREFGGAGLGLSICKKLTEQLGGALSLDYSDSDGSTFSVVLPLRTPGIASVVDAIEEPCSTPARFMRVLLVEDNSVNQLVAKRYLESLGAGVVIAGDGREALAKPKQTRFDLVLLDKHMPVMNGLETIRAIRASGNWSDLLVYACTADAMTGEKQALMAAGFSGFVPKPLTREALVEALAEAGESALHSELLRLRVARQSRALAS